ncbi:hypothetical protein H310_06101 [Aphanomyces invadans]|uniref:PX domain-containing protein n=1 Tax=Aphanomyces invadans TaxID=157072 RepID=A0A024U8N3_9STRA|nr:hypothetical protein H310_06101 [Aphanomyces invadans]ETW02639.1 hypothetical protein H310_06101 [Aphanomyces invadans]|eukprot:XP_008869244.1 hypothetical protein H310_06101 [Aphanomyces invadans]
MVFKVHAISPVSAKVVAVGEINRVIVYILRVDCGGRTKYVSRRYSEFRDLKKEIHAYATTPRRADSCQICCDVMSLGLNRSDGFPRRKLLHSESLAVARMEELSVFVKNLMISTQGLLDESCAIPAKLRSFFLLPSSHTSTSLGPKGDDIDAGMVYLTTVQLRMIRQTDAADFQNDTEINSPPTNALHRQHSLVIYP